MNEKITKNIIYLSIISMLFILICILGKVVYDDGIAYTDVEEKLQATNRKIQSIETGLDFIGAESGRRIIIIDNLRTENNRFRENNKRTTERYTETLRLLRDANRELDRIRREGTKGIEIIKEASEGFERELEEYREIIKEIEKMEMD